MPHTPSLDTASEHNCLAFKVRRAARAICSLHDTALAPYNLSQPQFNLLSTLAKAGLRSISEIANSTTTDRTTLTRNLALLKRRGLVESATGRDKRTHRFVLTPAGRAAQSSAKEAWLPVQEALYNSIGKTRFERLHKDLDVLLSQI